MDGVLFSGLPPEPTLTVDHILAAQKDGLMVRLTAGQIVTLVQAAILDGAPGALDTLNELAAALGDDADFAGTVVAALAEKAGIASVVRHDAVQSLLSSEKKQARANILAVGNLHKVTVITASTTHNFDSETTLAEVIVVGGGGAGGGALSPGSGNAASGGGGGAAAVVEKFFSTSGIASGTVTIGAGGAGSTGAGGTGGTSSWSDGTNTLSASGGVGGAASVATSNGYFAPGGAGGGATGGDINAPGAPGETGSAWSVSAIGSVSMALGGFGASGPYGAGGNVVIARSNVSLAVAGNAASGNGAGGSGGCGVGTPANATSGAGSAGLVIVKEYR